MNEDVESGISNEDIAHKGKNSQDDLCRGREGNAQDSLHKGRYQVGREMAEKRQINIQINFNSAF